MATRIRRRRRGWAECDVKGKKGGSGGGQRSSFRREGATDLAVHLGDSDRYFFTCFVEGNPMAEKVKRYRMMGWYQS